MTYRAAWTKLPSGTWGVEVRDTLDDLSGQSVTVTKKDGTTSQVLLGDLVSTNEYGMKYAVGLGEK
jgi:hypothetical protein